MSGSAEEDPVAVAETATAATEVSSSEPFSVIKQEVELEVNLREKSVTGVSTLWIFPLEDDLEEIALDARQMEIDVDNVTVNDVKVLAENHDPYDVLQIPMQWQLGVSQHHILRSRLRSILPDKRPDVPISEREKQILGCVPADRSLLVGLRSAGSAPKDGTLSRVVKLKAPRADKDTTEDKDLLKVSIPFRSKRIRDGLHFAGVDDGDLRYPHVYTRHSIGPGTASCIFPCVDDPSSRHAWKVSIKCPRTVGDAFAQRLATQSAAPSAAPSTANRKRKPGENVPSPPQPCGAPMAEEDKLQELTVVCSGNLSGEQIDPADETKKIMTFECQNSAAQHIAFAVGPFEHIDLWAEFRTEEADEKLGANAAKIHAYCLPGRADEVRHACSPIVAAADYFAPEFGKYPFESYKVCFVEDMVQSTASATSMSLCSTRLLYPKDIIEPELDTTRTLIHALASQYFGVHIVPDQRTDSWIVVAAQWFMTDYFLRTLCGNNWYRFHLKEMSDKLVEVDINRPSLHDLGNHLHLGDFELEFMSLKAPIVLFILDQRMSKIPGSTGVVRVISNMVSNANISNTDPKHTSVSDVEFRRACEKRSQYRPDELWDQWVRHAGCPKLSIKQRFNKKNLNVDIVITQTQSNEKPKHITKDDFWRELQEEFHNVYAGETPKLFTGPFTIRIHEADGTPYEHYQAITDKDKNGTNLSIAYNTKYKRLKRTKKAQAAAASGGGDRHDIQEDDVVYFNMLGDILQSEKEMTDWGLEEWDQKIQAAMDGESYEWIRFDCNFEWAAEINTDMPGYMYLAQLQQDRDVVAHQDAMLFFNRVEGHSVASTILTRTAMDRRYYPGIRTMAIEGLPKHCVAEVGYIGMFQLILTFRHYYCDRITVKSPGGGNQVGYSPVLNDFHDKGLYAVQCALPAAIARTRHAGGRCSGHARNFILELLLFNNNSENEYSDQFYIAKLLEALTTSLIPDKVDEGKVLVSTLKDYDEADAEFKNFIQRAIEEIDKYRRMDEWFLSYQNIWTTTALNCKMRLMKERIIPVAPLEFVQYLQDDNLDLVRIKAFECLVELGMLSKGPILKLLLSSLSTDKSPFVRDRLFNIFCRGIAAIALGENKISSQPEPEPMEDDGILIVDQGDTEIQQRKRDAVRKEDITHALQALKEELRTNTDLPLAIWRAVESPIIGLKEKAHLLDLCAAMFDPELSMLVTLNYPKYWNCERVEDDNVADPRAKQNKRCIIRFVQAYRTEPTERIVMETSPPPAELPPSEPRPQAPSRIRLSSKASFSGPSANGPSTPIPSARQDSISVPATRPSVAPSPAPSANSGAAVPSDSISVQPIARVSTPLVGTPSSAQGGAGFGEQGSLQGASTSRPTEKKAKVPKKRKSDEGEGSGRPKKIIKTERTESGPTRGTSQGAAQSSRNTNGGNQGSGTQRRVVRVNFNAWDKLPQNVRDEIEAENATMASSSTIVATPASSRPRQTSATMPSNTARTPVPSGSREPVGNIDAATPGTKVRKPLPSSAPHHGGPSSSSAATPKPSAPTPGISKKITIKIPRKDSKQGR